MTSDNLPRPYRGSQPPLRQLANPSVNPSLSSPPIHPPGNLGFGEGPDRDYWWSLLGESAKARIATKAGKPIEWWAAAHTTHRGRPFAVVFGTEGLVVASPMINDVGGYAQRLDSWHVKASSHRHVLITQHPSRNDRGKWSPTGAFLPAAGSSIQSAQVELELDADMRRFLGNLPVEAQQHLQAPFVTTDPILSSGFHYYGNEELLDAWCYIAGRRSVTFIAGRRTMRSGGEPHQAGWRLVCRQADVQKKADGG